MRKLMLALCCLVYSIAVAQTSSERLMYVGTLDKKLLLIDEGKEQVVGEIPLGGIPRTTVLSADKKKLHIFSTQMLLETVDLESKKVISSFSLNDPRTRLRIQTNAPDLVNIGNSARYTGVAVDPNGRYLYTSTNTGSIHPSSSQSTCRRRKSQRHGRFPRKWIRDSDSMPHIKCRRTENGCTCFRKIY